MAAEWSCSDGSRIALGGKTTADGAVARAIADALYWLKLGETITVDVGARPSGSVALDPNDPFLLGEFVSTEAARLGYEVTDAPSVSVPEWATALRSEDDDAPEQPGAVY